MPWPNKLPNCFQEDREHQREHFIIMILGYTVKNHKTLLKTERARRGERLLRRIYHSFDFEGGTLLLCLSKIFRGGNKNVFLCFRVVCDALKL
jgi:hypothetical protein